MTAAGTVAALVATSVALFALLSVARWWRKRWYLQAGSIAFLGHAFFAIAILPRLPYNWDIADFHQTAVEIQSGAPAGSSTSVNAFATFQSLLYATFSSDPVVVAIFNGLFAVLVTIPIVDLASRLYPTLRESRALGITVLFLPVPFVFMTIPMRDALSVLLFFVFLAASARAYGGQLWPVVLAIPLWGILYLLRPELGLIVLGGTLAGGLVKALCVLADRPPSLPGLAALAAGPGLAGLLVVGPRLPVASFDAVLQVRASGGGAYLEHVAYTNWTDLVVLAPSRALYFQYAPFPLHVTSIVDAVTATMLPILVVLTVAAYRSARQCERDLAVLVLLLATYVLGIVGYGLIDSNFGTTVRHRIPFTFLLCILAAPTLERWANLLLGPIGVTPSVDSTPAAERIGN